MNSEFSDSTVDSQLSDPAKNSELPSKARRLASYLARRVADEGELYAKSRFIAEDVDLSSKEVGSYMSRIGERTDLTVEQWAYTNGTTWRITKDQ